MIKNKLEYYRNNSKIIVLIFLLILISLSIYPRSFAYIMPSEQLLGFMTKNFSGIRTMVIIQSTLRETSEDTEKVQKHFKEQLWLKSPGFFQSRLLEQEQIRPELRDLSYRRLTMSGSRSDIETYLRNIGIELEEVSLTRLDGVIAFRIGAPGTDSPALLIEKERFLPLLLCYHWSNNPDKLVTVRFKDYRKLEKGWYPFEITCSLEGELRQTSRIQSYEVNVPVNPSIFAE